MTCCEQAVAFCRTTTCTDLPEGCELAPETGCAVNGKPLAWWRSCVGFNVQADKSTLRKLSASDLEAALLLASNEWTHADCEDRGTSLVLESLGLVQCDSVEFNSEGSNANIWMFRDNKWSHGDGGPDVSHLAYTTLTYDVDSGEILDADVELNTMNLSITLNPEAGSYDLQTVVTHEMGHFLGLNHSTDDDAIMAASFPPGISRHVLQADDAEGYCSIYAHAQGDALCTPQGGFSEQCGEDQLFPSEETSEEGSAHCQYSPKPSRPPAAPLLAGLVFSCWALRRPGRAGENRQ